ncbi:MAG: dihydroneopterin aldolase [Spirochaetota bacterium]
MGVIHLEEIEVWSNIGISPRERENKQKMHVSVSIIPSSRPDQDSIECTLDYSSVKQEVIDIASSRQFNLIETLAEEIAEYLKHRFPMKSLTVTVKKYPYQDVKYVSYQVSLGGDK